MIKKGIVRSVQVLALFVVAALLVGVVLGQPVLFGYVATGSMEPTLMAGDGFVAIPAPLAGDIEEGDVVTFEAEELHGGGLTTHRVVDVRGEEYVTRGDANPFTDQDGDEPPVTEEQIVAVALEVDGTVVRIPYLGTAIETTGDAVGSVSESLSVLPGNDLFADDTGAIFVWSGVGLLVVAAILERTASRDRSRSQSRPATVDGRVVLCVLLVLVVIPTTATMIAASETTEFEVLSSTNPPDSPFAAEPGETITEEYPVTNGGLFPVVAVLEPTDERIDLEDERMTVGPRAQARTEATIAIPEETGYHGLEFGEYRYLLVLPPSVLIAAHEVHPALAIVAVNAVVVTAIVVVLVALVGLGTYRMRSTAPDVPLSVRLRRKWGR